MPAPITTLYPVRRGDRVSIEGGIVGTVWSMVMKRGVMRAVVRPLRCDVAYVTYMVPVDRLTLEPREPPAC